MFESELRFNETRAMELLVEQVDAGPRIPEQEGHNITLDIMRRELQRADLETFDQVFVADYGRAEGLRMNNVIGVREAEEPVGDGQIILAAHFDTRPWADRDFNKNTVSPIPATPIPGANDGASGVAVLLELANALVGRNLSVDLRFVFFDGEDYGPEISSMFYGSKYYADHMTDAEVDRTIALVLLDMIGDAELVVKREGNSNDALLDDIFDEAAALGVSQFQNVPGPSIIDDHLFIEQRGVAAVVDLIDFDYPNKTINYWHTLEDDVDKVSAESLGAVGSVVESYLLTKTWVADLPDNTTGPIQPPPPPPPEPTYPPNSLRDGSLFEGDQVLAVAIVVMVLLVAVWLRTSVRSSGRR